MRIAHLCQPLRVPPRAYGGVERVVYDLAREQVRSGHQVTIYAGSGSRTEGARSKWFSLPLRQKQFWPVWKLNTGIHVLRSLNDISDTYDVVHNHVGEEGIGLTRFSKTKCLATLHGAPPENLTRKTIAHITSLGRRCKLVSISADSCSRFGSYYGNDMIGYVYDGIDLDRYSYLREPERRWDLQLCFVGKLIPQKGLHNAILVTQQLLETGMDVQLRVCGPKPEARSPYYKAMIRLAKGMSEISFHFDLPDEQLIEIMGNSDALIYPVEWRDPAGLVVIEALACGTPVIATRRGAIPELLTHGQTGFICDTTDELVDYAAKAAKLDRSACREHAEERFSAMRMRKDYDAVYATVA